MTHTWWQIAKYLGWFVLVVLLGLGLCRFRGWQVRRHAEAFLSEAREDAAAGRPADALRNLEIALELSPQLVEAYALMAASRWEKPTRPSCETRWITCLKGNGTSRQTRSSASLSLDRSPW